MQESDILEFRKFLHELNNKLAIPYGRSMILKKMLNQVEDDDFVKQLIEQNNLIYQGLEVATECINQKRQEIKKLQGI